MLLQEMFSPLGGPKNDQPEVDWLDDLKFYIDNNNTMLQRHIFPTVEKHKKYLDHPEAYKLYIRPLKSCCESYCKEFKIDEIEAKFPESKLLELAKHIAEKQKEFIQRGDYDFSDK